MRGLLLALALGVASVALAGASTARADDDSATHYYLSLGDSLAAGSSRSTSARPTCSASTRRATSSSACSRGPTATRREPRWNGRLTSTYAAAGAPVADVAGAFHNGEQPLSAHLVCAWTWFCSLGDGHLNTTGYGVVANEFLEVIQP
jgi:hypothetical protein